MATFFGPTGSGDGSFDEFLARYLQGQRPARFGQPMDITKLLSRRTHEVLGSAAQFAVGHGQLHVDALHILRVMAETRPATDYIKQAGAAPAAIAKAAKERLPEKTAATATPAPALTPSAQSALLDAYQVARAFGSTYIDPEHLFFALVVNQESPAGQVLAAAGVTPESLQPGPEEPASPSKAAPPRKPGASRKVRLSPRLRCWTSTAAT